MNALHILPYQRSDREAVLELLYASRFQHQQLDWHTAGRWLDAEHHLVYLAWEGATNRLLGLLGFTPPLFGSSWLRLAAVDAQHEPTDILPALWAMARPQLSAAGANQAAVLVVNLWLALALPQMGYAYQQDVVTMYRSATVPSPRLPLLGGVEVAVAYLDVLPELVAIDHAAFYAPWQMSRDELRQAQRQAASCTWATYQGLGVGFQMSTRDQNHGHLARLAVHPDFQGRGIGGLLVAHLIQSFARRHVYTLSVNTQMSNLASQRLYERYGFRRNGFDVPVWLCSLDR